MMITQTRMKITKDVTDEGNTKTRIKITKGAKDDADVLHHCDYNDDGKGPLLRAASKSSSLTSS